MMHRINTYNYSASRRQTRKLGLKSIFILLFIVSVILTIPRIFRQLENGKPLVAPIASIGEVMGANVSGSTFMENFFSYSDTNLTPIIEQSLKDERGEFAIYIETLEGSSKEQYTQNENEVFLSASLYKLFVAAAIYEEIEQGRLSKEQRINTSLQHLEEVLGGEEYGYADSGEQISYSIEQALQRMITISDNYASIMLAEKVGWNKVQEQAEKIGTKNTIFKSPIKSTASDVALFYRKLYHKEIVSEKASTEILEILKDQRINNRIPDQLPDNLQIAHKTGELPGIRHDAGIVFLDNKPYLIVLMSRDLEYDNDGIKIFSDLSKEVYDYFARS